MAWANEQAALLRTGDLSVIDVAHIAEEIEDVGKGEQRELASRMAVLLAHLLNWNLTYFQKFPRGLSMRCCRRNFIQNNDAGIEEAVVRIDHFEDAEEFRDFSNILADMAIEVEGLAFTIPHDMKYVRYRERLFDVATEIRKIHGGLLAAVSQAV